MAFCAKSKGGQFCCCTAVKKCLYEDKLRKEGLFACRGPKPISINDNLTLNLAKTDTSLSQIGSLKLPNLSGSAKFCLQNADIWLTILFVQKANFAFRHRRKKYLLVFLKAIFTLAQPVTAANFCSFFRIG